MKKLHFLIPVIIILLIVGDVVLMVRNLKYIPREGISKNQLSLYNVEELAVDENGNYYIGNLYNQDIQVFDSEGNYKNTLTFSGKSCSFSIEKNKIIITSYSGRDQKNIVDLDTMEIIDKEKISGSESDDTFSEYSQMQERFYKLNDTTYEIKRNPILYNKIIITKNGKTETLILKDVPIFPLPGYVHLAVLVLLFLALILYTNVILYPNKFKERIMEVRNTYEKIRCFNRK